MIAELSFAETLAQSTLPLCREGCSIACGIRPVFPALEKDGQHSSEAVHLVGDFSCDLFTFRCNFLSDLLKEAVKRLRNAVATISILRSFRGYVFVIAPCRHFPQGRGYRFGRVVLHISYSVL